MLRHGLARSAASPGAAAPRLRTTLRRRVPIGLIAPGLFALAFLLAGAGAVLTVRYYAHQRALEEAAATATVILDRNLATHHYFSRQLKPAVAQYIGPAQFDGFFDPRWMSSTYAVREIDKEFRQISAIDYYYKEAAVDARNPENEADPAEAAFIRALNADPTLAATQDVRTLDGQPYFVIMHRGEVMQASCLRCHGDPAAAPTALVERYGTATGFGRQVGATVSSISIRVPLSAAYAEADRLSGRLSAFLLGLLAVLFFVTYWMQNILITRPLAAIARKSREFVRDETHLGETLAPPATGAELVELVETFNALSVALRRERDGLAEHVRLRTIQLQHANLQLQVQVLSGEQLREDLQTSLSQKDVLLQEVHHRVKNNLQIVSSLLALQARSTRDAGAQQALVESQERIRALALVHQKLYGSADLSRLDLGDYLGAVIRQLVATYNADPGRLETRLVVEPVQLEIDQVVPCGLIVTELVSNALKHAFADGRSGTLEVRVQTGPDGRVEIIVSDDGPGLPFDLDVARTQSLGLRLVSILARQLRADLHVDTSRGATFRLSFIP